MALNNVKDKDFLEAREAFKQSYIKNIKEYTQNIDKYLVEAINNRESISNNGTKINDFKTHDEVTKVLDEINNKYINYNARLNQEIKKSVGYELHEPLRIAGNIINIGIPPEQLDALPMDIILKYEGMLFLAGFHFEKEAEVLYNPLNFENDIECDYIVDQRELRKECQAEALKIIGPDLNLIVACKLLEKTVIDNSIENAELKEAGLSVLEAVKNIDPKLLTSNEKNQITRFIEGTTNVINSPTAENINKYSTLAQEANSSGNNQSWGKKLAGAMLICLGKSVVALSKAAEVATFGATSSLSIAGLEAGEKLAAKGNFIMDKFRVNNLDTKMDNVSKFAAFKSNLNDMKKNHTPSKDNDQKSEAENTNEADSAPKFNR